MAAEPDQSEASVPVSQEAVIAELLTDPMGKALYERAQYKVATDALATQRSELFARIRELETQGKGKPDV